MRTKITASLFFIILLLTLSSCAMLRNSVLEGSIYAPIPPDREVSIDGITIVDSSNLEVENRFLIQALSAKLRENGFTIVDNSMLSVSLEIYEKVLKSSLTGDRSITGILSFFEDEQLAARVFYISEQPNGIDSDALLHDMLEKLFDELNKSLKKNEKK